MVATLKKLADEGEIDVRLVSDAIASFGINADQLPAWQPQPHHDYYPDAPAPARPTPKSVPELKDDIK